MRRPATPDNALRARQRCQPLSPSPPEFEPLDVCTKKSSDQRQRTHRRGGCSCCCVPPMTSPPGPSAGSFVTFASSISCSILRHAHCFRSGFVVETLATSHLSGLKSSRWPFPQAFVRHTAVQHTFARSMSHLYLIRTKNGQHRNGTPCCAMPTAQSHERLVRASQEVHCPARALAIALML